MVAARVLARVLHIDEGQPSTAIGTLKLAVGPVSVTRAQTGVPGAKRVPAMDLFLKLVVWLV